jgi:5-methylcytosine-specific restriction endonuclease McrA
MSGNRPGTRNKGVGIGKAKRQRIYAAYDHRCWICGNKPDHLTLDHVKPRKYGGSIHASNLRPACGKCNLKRDEEIRKLPNRAAKIQQIREDEANLQYQLYDPSREFERALLYAGRT